MFNSKKEFALAMIEGREFVAPNGNICFYKEDDLFETPFRVQNKLTDNIIPMMETWDLYDQVTEKHWFGKPCLCWAEDVEHPVVIFYYKAGDETPYHSEYDRHKTAKPLTKEELLEYLPV